VMALVRPVSEEVQTALEAGILVARDFLWITVKERVSGAPVSRGFWSDIGNVSAAVINPVTNTSVTRNWRGTGSLIEIDDIPQTANLEVQTIRVKLNQIDQQVDDLIKVYEARQAPIEIYRGL